MIATRVTTVELYYLPSKERDNDTDHQPETV